MSAYFPLPPTIKSAEFSNHIFGSITFLNYPNNRLKRTFLWREYEEIVFLGIYVLRNYMWTLLSVQKCNPYEFIEISRNHLNVEDHEMVVAVGKKSNSFIDSTLILPKPDSLKVDNSIVAQRTSLNFSYLKSTTSYQGEYPFSMSNLDNGSLLTFDKLKSRKNSSQKNFLILMNISRKSTYKEIVKIKIFDPKNKSDYIVLDAKKNYFSIFETDLYEKKFKNSSTCFITSKSCLFIPIMLTINYKNNCLSVEHTHPPTEYFFGAQKLKITNLIKKEWL